MLRLKVMMMAMLRGRWGKNMRKGKNFLANRVRIALIT